MPKKLCLFCERETEMIKKKIIVTADDYGMSRGVNDAIDAGIEAGLITSTNVMTNMEYYNEASKLKKTGVSVGLHWNISAGKPISDAKDIPSLVDRQGKFFSYAEFRSRYRNKQISDEDLKKELIAQYRRFTDVCGEPDYWNTHQNTHVDFRIFKLFTDIAAELGIFKMRSHKRIYIPSSNGKSSMSVKWIIAEPIKRFVLNNWVNYSEKKGMKLPFGVVLALNKEDLKNPPYCFSHMKITNNQVAEYVIHPSTVLDSEYFGSIGEDRISEYKQFTSDEQKEIFKANGFELVTFKRLDEKSNA